MIFETAMSGSLAEVAYRVVRNSLTKTTTITAGTAGMGLGAPVVLETHTASCDGVFIKKSPASNTDVMNNLYIGNMHWGGSVYSYLNADEIGLCQCYGYDSDAIVTAKTDAVTAVGFLALPETGCLVTVSNVVCGPLTSTGAQIGLPGLGGLAVFMADVASSSAAGTTTGKVFLRCM